MNLPSGIALQEIKHTDLGNTGVRLSVARFDNVHPVVSGNKLFKLYYFLQRAKKGNKKLITYGGAFSNHLAATAFACRNLGLNSIGLVRGEAPPVKSDTLHYCAAHGMEMKFLSREVFDNKCENFYEDEHEIRVPMGGYHPIGAEGAALMMNYLFDDKFTHVACSAGTATMLAGLIKGNAGRKKIVVIPAIKNMTDIEERLQYLLPNEKFELPETIIGYEFGGYAKHNDTLLNFMNEFYRSEKIMTDVVYTSKLFYGIIDQIKKGHFAEGSHLIAIHSGGLQGNSSVKDKLIF